MKRVLGAIGAICVLVGAVLLVQRGYSVPWTGFGAYFDADGKVQRSKTLWDWLDLLVVPVFLAVGAWFLDGSRKASDARVEADRQRQATLNDYFTCMTEMLLEGKLIGPSPVDEARSIARTRTLAALRALDGGRKAQLLQFLYESGLIGSSPVVQLIGADLSDAQLDEADLSQAELRGVYFQGASFRRATLVEADLRGSDFTGADFTGANIQRAKLVHANLSKAKITPGMLKAAITE